MTAPRRFTFDTNCLVYAANADAGNKHTVATVLLETAPMKDCVLTLQAMGEFIDVVRRKEFISMDEVVVLSRLWPKYFEIVPPNLAGCKEALGHAKDHKITYWDALLWVTARQAGCAYVLSEDMQHGRSLGGVEVVNPFVEESKPIIEELFQ